MFRRTITVLAVLALAAPLCAQEEPAAAPKETFRVYFVGNSVTDVVNYRGLAKLAASRGIEQVWGRHMIPGSPLFGMWQSSLTEKPHGFTEEPFGACKKALSEFQWDAVTVQPFDRHITTGGDQSDLFVINEMIKTAVPRSPNVQFYIYARWPRMRKGRESFKFNKDDYDPNVPGSGIDWRRSDPYEKTWEAEYTGGWDGTYESRDFFHDLQKAVNEANPDLAKPVLIIPVGHVMARMSERIRDGEVPGFENIYQFYKDGIHLNKYGSYLVGCTFFATLYGQDPVGLPSEPYGEIPAEIVKLVQETVRDVVTAVKESGREGLAEPGAE